MLGSWHKCSACLGIALTEIRRKSLLHDESSCLYAQHNVRAKQAKCRGVKGSPSRRPTWMKQSTASITRRS